MVCSAACHVFCVWRRYIPYTMWNSIYFSWRKARHFKRLWELKRQILTVSLKVLQKICLNEFPSLCWGSWKQQKIEEGLWLIYIHTKTLKERETCNAFWHGATCVCPLERWEQEALDSSLAVKKKRTTQAKWYKRNWKPWGNKINCSMTRRQVIFKTMSYI